MMRSTKGSRADHRYIGGQNPGDGLDRNHLERLGFAQFGENSRETTREHRLSRTWRTGHAKIVSSGRRDLESALCRFLTDHVGEIERRFLSRDVDQAILRWRQCIGSQLAGQYPQILRRRESKRRNASGLDHILLR